MTNQANMGGATTTRKQYTSFATPNVILDTQNSGQNGEELDKRDALIQRYWLQNVACEVLAEQQPAITPRIQICCKLRLNAGLDVQVKKRQNAVTGELSRAFFGNLVVCGLKNVCPICSQRAAYRDRQLLGAAVRWWDEQGGVCVMLTLTLSHKAYQTASEVITRLKGGLLGGSKIAGAMRDFKAGKGYAVGIKKRFDIQHMVSSFEVLHGNNGFHCHYHVCLFLGKGLTSAEQVGLDKAVTKKWNAALRKNGAWASKKHGAVLTYGNTAVSDYVTKQFQSLPKPKWTLDSELTGQAVKQSVGRTPFELLQDYALGDVIAGGLFRDYALGIAGKAQIVYSAGLKALVEAYQGEQAEPLITPLERLLVSLNNEHWKTIISHPDRALRGKLLKAADSGEEALAGFLAHYLPTYEHFTD